MSWASLTSSDSSLSRAIERLSIPTSRLSLFLVYFWFGILKLIDSSPANPLVASLLERTLPFVSFNQFIVALGVFEIVIGLAFLVPGWEKIALLLLIPHMVTTFMPLILLPQIAWQAPFTPTLEGQYIIKNVLIISLALVLFSHVKLHPPTQNGTVQNK